MGILFVLKTFEVGGVEIVTACLANQFVKKGFRVSITAFSDASHSIINMLDEKVKTYTLRGFRCSKENISLMRCVMLEERVQIVINQWGLPFFPLRTALKAANGLGVKFISVYHNTPDRNGRLQSIDDKLAQTNNPLKCMLLNVLRSVFYEITAQGMRWNYYHSDRYVVLSPSFVETFKAFTGIRTTTKLIIQTNPVTIDCGRFEYDIAKKQKEILFVGRLDFCQKRVYRVVDTWAQLESSFPDWHMTIIGDGSERENVEVQAKKLSLQRISFEGFQSPLEYYKRTSLLILTSEYEGFPLVLAEAMSFGVIPVVYGSYSAVYDIISDGVDGMILPYNKKGYDTEFATEKMKELMLDADKRNNLAQAAIITSKRYSVESIVDSWNKLFAKL